MSFNGSIHKNRLQTKVFLTVSRRQYHFIIYLVIYTFMKILVTSVWFIQPNWNDKPNMCNGRRFMLGINWVYFEIWTGLGPVERLDSRKH